MKKFLLNKSLVDASFWIIIFGALSMGVYGLTGGFDIVEDLFGESFPFIADAINTIIGLAGVHQLIVYFQSTKKSSS